MYTDAPAVLLVHVGLAQARPNDIYDVVEAHATATDFFWGIWAIRVVSKKLIVERFDCEGLHQLQNWRNPN